MSARKPARKNEDEDEINFRSAQGRFDLSCIPVAPCEDCPDEDCKPDCNSQTVEAQIEYVSFINNAINLLQRHENYIWLNFVMVAELICLIPSCLACQERYWY